MTRAIALGGLAVAAMAGCSNGGDYFGTSSVIVYGIVSRNGSVVPGARVYPYLFLGSCGSPTVRGAFEVTGADGHFSQLIQVPFSEQTGCLVVQALADRGSTTDSITVSGVSVLVKDDSHPGPSDSTRIDIAFP